MLVLIGLGLGGVLAHNLVKLDTINRKEDGNLKFGQYLKIERFSIILSVLIVLLCAFISEEIKVLNNAGIGIGLGFVTIGYMAQSLLVHFMGKADKKIKGDE